MLALLSNSKKIFCIALLLLLAGCLHKGEFQDHLGNVYRLDDTNARWVLVNVWATWCPTCIEEMPELNKFYQKHRSKILVIGANFDNIRTAKLRRAIDKYQIKFPILLGDFRETFKLPPVNGVPTSFLLSPKGKILKVFSGPVTVKQLEAELIELGEPV